MRARGSVGSGKWGVFGKVRRQEPPATERERALCAALEANVEDLRAVARDWGMTAEEAGEKLLAVRRQSDERAAARLEAAIELTNVVILEEFRRRKIQSVS